MAERETRGRGPPRFLLLHGRVDVRLERSIDVSSVMQVAAHAIDAATGTLLWQFPANSGITGQPSSFAVAGQQCIAVQSG
ncbi:MAG TPA: hypothetical protein VMW48_07965 [Vicinamibacterales bacterium]|nr:hypothetical protein [Vicinamibacterales bacterium]